VLRSSTREQLIRQFIDVDFNGRIAGKYNSIMVVVQNRIVVDQGIRDTAHATLTNPKQYLEFLGKNHDELKY
jgi:hypothetical protein